MGHYEEVELTESSVNLGPERIGPHCFKLLSVLGKGAYGKVLATVPLMVTSALARGSIPPLTPSVEPLMEFRPGNPKGGEGRSSQSDRDHYCPALS